MASSVLKTHFSSIEFIQKIKDRDHDKLELLVRNYTTALYRCALGLGFDSNNANELVQQTWTTFYDVVHKFEGRSHIRTYIFGILYNKASEARRQDYRIDHNDPIEDILESRFDENGSWKVPPKSPEEFLMASQSLDIIEECMGKLPSVQKMAFCLKEVEGHKTNDICETLGISISNLGVLLFRARNRLRECIERKSNENSPLKEGN